MPFNWKAAIDTLVKQAADEDAKETQTSGAVQGAGNNAGDGGSSAPPSPAAKETPTAPEAPKPETPAAPAAQGYTQEQLNAAIEAAVSKALEQSRANAANAQQSAQTFIAANGQQRTADGPWDTVSVLRAQKGDAAVNALTNEQMNALFGNADLSGGFDFNPALLNSGR